MPVSTACKSFSVDLHMFDPVDLIHGWDILDDEVFHRLICLCERASWVRHLLPHTVASTAVPLYVVRVRGQFGRLCIWTVFPTNVQQQLAVQESAIVHDRARHLLSADGLIILENPSSSMTWLDDLMQR